MDIVSSNSSVKCSCQGNIDPHYWRFGGGSGKAVNVNRGAGGPGTYVLNLGHGWCNPPGRGVGRRGPRRWGRGGWREVRSRLVLRPVLGRARAPERHRASTTRAVCERPPRRPQRALRSAAPVGRRARPRSTSRADILALNCTDRAGAGP